MKFNGLAITTSSKKARTNSIGVLLCLLVFSMAAQANDVKPTSSGWSLLPENTVTNKPIYTLNPLPLSSARVENTTSTTPLKLLTANTMPLFFELQNGLLTAPAGSASTGQLSFAGTLGWQPLDQLVVALGLHNSILDRPTGADHFQAISNIRCESALLEAGSYHASNCRFTDGSEIGGQLINRFTSLGATWAPSLSARTNTSVQLEYFQQRNSSATYVGLPNYFNLSGNRGLLPATLAGEQTSLDGIGVNFALGINHNSVGKVQLGLQLSRINSVEINSAATNYGFNLGSRHTLQQAPIAPYNTAAVNFDWRRGSFSGGVQGFYREPLSLYNQTGTESMAGFDIYFSWHTPWNANLSIGASSMLDTNSSHSLASDNSDPFELIYGRVPYVRYQQDL